MVEWGLVGWQGLKVRVPPNWVLGKVEGTRLNGYLRLDDPEMPRLELRWGPSGGSKRSIETLAERYLKQARKIALRSKTPFEYQYRKPFFSSGGRELVYLTLQSDYPSHIIVSRCKSCGRVVLARVLHRPDESVGQIVGVVFGTLRDHAPSGKNLWSVFDLHARVPDAFELSASSFPVGAIRLEFLRGKDRLVLERYNFARDQLGGESLKRWLVQVLRKELKPFRLASDKAAYRGHEVVCLTGQPRTWQRIVSIGLRRRGCSVVAWACPQSDRLYAVRLFSRSAGLDELVSIANTVVCHQRA